MRRAAIRTVFADIDRLMRRSAPTVLLITALLSGCAESQLAGHLLYMTPYKIEALDCTELKKKADGATTRAKELEQVREKAAGSAAGPVINTMVYGPDYTKARWEQRLYEEEIARKSCAFPPPGTPR
jgi:hypothetical protein